jgi:hypothetical protein
MLRIVIASVVLALSAYASGKEVLVLPPRSAFTLSSELFDPRTWNFAGECDVSGTISARLHESEIEVFLLLTDEERGLFPFLESRGPPVEIEIGDFDAPETYFTQEAIASLEKGDVRKLERSATVHAHHYQIWLDEERAAHSVFIYSLK